MIGDPHPWWKRDKFDLTIGKGGLFVRVYRYWFTWYWPFMIDFGAFT